MGGINGATLKTDAVEGGLYDYILLSMNASAYLMPGSRGYAELIPETAKLKAVLKAGRGTIVTGSQYVLIPYRYCPNVVTAAGRALSNHGSHF
jgi:hypothetical protein